jgi:CRISPR-associated endonuclease/helicase Cas3
LNQETTFPEFCRETTGDPSFEPYRYQSRMACGDPGDRALNKWLGEGTRCASRQINIPTGLGKTAAVIHAWLWNRVRLANPDWPRRLVFCLPMRTLVEQTADSARHWLTNLGVLWNEEESHHGKVGLHLLMGGDTAKNWDLFPEEDAILVGTQDMLLSRALNRGYGLSRFRWPMHFGLLNNDCLWVFDEIQLMGAGLPTTTQLSSFREILGTDRNSHTWWMSATGEPAWLKTVDFDPITELASPIALTNDEKQTETVSKVRGAPKSLRWSEHASDDKELPSEIAGVAAETPGLTLVVVNTVATARRLHADLLKLLKDAPDSQRPILLHSHFRPADRSRQLDAILAAEKAHQSRIVVSTQVVEAGVDLSARTLFSELAPWSSLVQRFGRCNRRGDHGGATIHLIEPKNALPYEDERLAEARTLANQLIADGADASPAGLANYPLPESDRPVSRHVIRKRDFIDLFDTTPDLSGQDIDIDRWVREIEDSKVRLFWREWDGANEAKPPPAEKRKFPAAAQQELCPAPISSVIDWFQKLKKKDRLLAWEWDHLTGNWRRIPFESGKPLVIPGRVYLLSSSQGGYDSERGFDPATTAPVPPIGTSSDRGLLESANSDHASRADTWQAIAEHTDRVCDELAEIIQNTGSICAALPHAARWHDLGKAHDAFKAKIKAACRESPEALPHRPFAKAPDEAWHHPNSNDHKAEPGYRAYYRHELASALAVLQPDYGNIPEHERDLVAWLIAAHHGKVRLSIRSLPDEPQPNGEHRGKRFARGVWDGDPLPQVDLGGQTIALPVTLSLEPMEMGLCESAPFEDQPSWIDRMLRLRDSPALGPLRLAFREVLLRAADERASAQSTKPVDP